MEKYCFDCYKEINKIKAKKEEYLLTYDLYICDKCKKKNNVVVVSRDSLGYNTERLHIYYDKLKLIEESE